MARVAADRLVLKLCRMNSNSYQPKRLAMNGAAEMPIGMPQIRRTRAGPKRMKVEERRASRMMVQKAWTLNSRVMDQLVAAW